MEPSKYTSLIQRTRRADHRRDQRLRMRADTIGIGAVIMAAMLALTVGMSL